MEKLESTEIKSETNPENDPKNVDSNDFSEQSNEENSVELCVNLSSELNRSLHLTTRSGKILTVKLRNFMCHANLTVDFNTHTNLLIGQNGNSRSAILTALIIGLGMEVNATNGSSTFKELIKSGESSATIELHISNDGSDAYKYEKYGDRVVVIRQLESSGSTTYKLKSISGFVVSTCHTEVLELISFMNIQVDNPVCVITQDIYRNFLEDSNPKKRYELFLKATQLDVVIEQLDGCLQGVHIAKSEFRSQQRQHANYLEIQRKAHEKLNQFKSMQQNNAVSSSNDSLESVTREAQEADKNVNRSDDLIKILGSTLKMMNNAVRSRMSNVSKIKQFMVIRTAVYFTEILKLRGIDGSLEFDNDAATLDIQVVPRDKNCANAVSKTTNLSGGERSYTTAAFLLSLWSVVDHPFYFLDGFDMNTDHINRMSVTELLLNEARKKSTQFTFCTSQSNNKSEKDLSIVRLESVTAIDGN